jgi:hypothetical protein
MFTETVRTPSWYLKGGYAIELRIETARTTKDVDLSIAAREAITPESLHRMVDDAASLDLADGFIFQVGESILDLDAAPQGGSRFPVQARMAGRPFVGFHLDIGIGYELIEPTDRIEGEEWFDFRWSPAAHLPHDLARAAVRRKTPRVQPFRPSVTTRIMARPLFKSSRQNVISMSIWNRR